MKFRLAACLALILTSGVLGADVPLSLSENPVKANSFGVVTVPTEKGDQVAFQVYPTPTKRETFGNKLVLSGPAGSKYTVMVTVVNFGDDGGKKRFDTGQIEVPIEGVKPDPDVDPDVDPKPTPDIEAATLTSKLNSAAKKETSADKLLLPKLKDLYAKYANETEIGKFSTWGALEKAMRTDAATYMVGGKLIEVQTAIHDYLVTKIPGANSGWEDVVISEPDRKTAKKHFQTVSTALGKIK